MALLSGKLNHDRNCLSWWFPKLLAAGIPTPETEIVRTDCNFDPLLEGNLPDGWEAFAADLGTAVDRIAGKYGFPVFLRTGQGSGKHQWRNTCCLGSRETLGRHVAALVEWSACVDFIGLPVNVWAVRQMLPVTPLAILDAYQGMPLVCEARYFVRESQVVCCHNYWPEKAICQGFAAEPEDGSLQEILSRAHDFALSVQVLGSHELAQRVAKSFDGAWSVDVLAAGGKLYVTDMAEAEQSWHWLGCPHEKEFAT